MNELNQMRALLQKLREAKEAKSTYGMVDIINWLNGEDGLMSDLDRMGYLIDSLEDDGYSKLELASDHTVKDVA